MNKAIRLGLSALALGAVAGGVAVAGERSAAQVERDARDDAAKATKALAKRNGDAAVHWAELAVTLKPQDASYRTLLGQSYLAAGRFGSARAAFTDSLTLTPGDGRVALNLALAQIADGDWSGARQTLDSHSGSIAISDRGLAMALAGDPAGAVDLMLPIARQAGADAKLRQNLALALALSGRWPDARMVAGMDLTPPEADKRMEQWAAFARPAGHADQVAALLGVTPASDPGQPVALALNAATPVVVAPVAATTIDAIQPSAPVVQPVAETVPLAIAAPGMSFAPRAEIVQPLPLRPIAVRPIVAAKPVKAVFVKPVVAAKPVAGATTVKSAFVKPMVAAKPAPGMAPVTAGKGNFFVQLGAYDNVAIARDDWGRASHRYAAFGGHAPQGMAFKAAGKTWYRLSVGGFDEAGARRMCEGYRAHGGKCFVRAGAGEKAVSWGNK